MAIEGNLPCSTNDHVGVKATAICEFQSVLLEFMYSTVVLYFDVPVNNQLRRSDV